MLCGGHILLDLLFYFYYFYFYGIWVFCFLRTKAIDIIGVRSGHPSMCFDGWLLVLLFIEGLFELWALLNRI